MEKLSRCRRLRSASGQFTSTAALDEILRWISSVPRQRRGVIIPLPSGRIAWRLIFTGIGSSWRAIRNGCVASPAFGPAAPRMLDAAMAKSTKAASPISDASMSWTLAAISDGSSAPAIRADGLAPQVGARATARMGAPMMD